MDASLTGRPCTFDRRHGKSTHEMSGLEMCANCYGRVQVILQPFTAAYLAATRAVIGPERW